MGPGGEFDTIRMLMSRWGDLAVDIGDDAAVLPAVGERTRVISTDACVEGAHFQRAWLSPYEVGVRAAAAALSDLAAMGARADAVLFALSVPEDWRPLLGELADGLASVVRASGSHIVGGNLSRANVLSITTTVVGSAQRVVARRGANVGDVLVVTGRLGGPGAALRDWLDGKQPSGWSRGRFVAPVPRLAEGAALAAAGATAMLDISDGLAADARHLAAASGVRLAIDPALLPVGDGITVHGALSSGEEYELFASLPPGVVPQIIAEWPSRFSVPLTVIGRVTAAEAAGALDFGNVAQADAGRDSWSGRVEFVSGHDHFSG
jgi:thiamine-monophosphate kinase